MSATGAGGTADARRDAGADAMSIIVAAHNEESTIARLLGSVLADATPGELEIHVVCNGCTDRTAQIASGFGPDVHVLELPEPSKRAALKAGDEVASGYPRLYLDADVQLSTADVRELRSALGADGVLAAGPERQFSFAGVPLVVRAYYAVWERLPQVRSGVFGRGAVAVSRAGHERIAALPPVMADDLAISEAFNADERVIVGGTRVTVWPPRTFRDLVRRRIRASTGVTELDRGDLLSAQSRTSWGDLAAIVRKEPALAVCVPVFVGVTAIARIGARRRVRTGDFTTWLRDESSRRPDAGNS
jgi:glycosyltransferase involved in cell wall biosynthesis